MRRLIDIAEGKKTASSDLTGDELVHRYPGIEADVAAVAEWVQGPLSYSVVTEPMTRFASRAQALLDTYPEFPSEKKRTLRIVTAIKRGADQWPIFVDAEDDFILEGRHRIVAFHILGLPTVPVVYVSRREPDPLAPFS